ncbi:transglutaminase-like domain-containing protein [Thalassospira sp. MA62]|nr:transglutaminase-like domain-containing protein [Thalassospira sp. MA62]
MGVFDLLAREVATDIRKRLVAASKAEAKENSEISQSPETAEITEIQPQTADLGTATIGQVISALQAVIAEKHGFQGDTETYEDVENADLMAVIDRKRGLPVALAMFYIHAARHCGMSITGIDFPGHFLLRLQVNGERRMIDPFHGGIVIGPAELRELLKSFSGLDAELTPNHYQTSSDLDLLLRLQNNVKVRALRSGQLELASRVIENSLVIAPTHEGLWHQLGALYSRLGEDRKALGAFKHFIDRCEDPLHRARIEAVVEELGDRLRLEGTIDQAKGVNDPDMDVSEHDLPREAHTPNAPIPLYPRNASGSGGVTGRCGPSPSDQ